MTDASLVTLREQVSAERRHGLQAGLGRHLEQQGVLRPGLTAQRAGDIVYAISDHRTYQALVVECEWSPDEYRDWLADTLAALLLPG